MLTAIAFLATRFSDLDVVTVTRDATQLGDLSIWAGSVQQIGIVLLVVSAAIVAFASSLVEAPESVPPLRQLSWFFAFLAFDDAFRFHEVIAPEVFGLPEEVVQPLYAVVALVIAIRHYTFWSTHLNGMLAIGVLGSATAVLGDMFGFGIPIEEGSKILGLSALAAWAIYLCQVEVRGMNRG